VIKAELDDIQAHLLLRAQSFQQANSVILHSKADFYEFFTGDGGFAFAQWDGSAEVEAAIKQDLGVTIRCIPFAKSDPGKCIFTGNASPQQVVFAKAY
jgi:prolyl-tRNA synthetase